MSDSPSMAESAIPDEDGAVASPVPHETDAPAEAVEHTDRSVSAAEGSDVSAHANADAAPAPEPAPTPAAREAAQAAAPGPAMRGVVPYIEAQYAEPHPGAPLGANIGSWAWTRNWGVRAAAIAAGFVVVSAGAAPFVMDRGPDPRVEETRHLADTIKVLNAKVEALEASRPRDETADLRKAFAEIKGNLASTHDVSATLAQITARLDKFEHEQDARTEKLAERVDRDVAARTTEIAARIEKLEKKAGAPLVAAAQQQPLKAAPIVAQQAPPQAPPKQATLLPPAAGVSRETTGSIAPPNTLIHGWVLREVLGDDAAVVEGRYGEREVAEGDILPGAGRVVRVERRGHGWVVVTSLGIIPMQDGVDSRQ
jgi:Skp family chaperone for outer membrane proteins